MYPIRFEIQMKKKSVATKGNQRSDISRDMFPRAIVLYVRSYITSMAVCTRFGLSVIRLAM